MARKLTNLVSRPGRAGPYLHRSGTVSVNQEVRDELVRLGVKLSLSVVQSMFLLCDDLHTMLSFCLKLWRPETPPPLTERLFRVIHLAYSSYIKPKDSSVYLAGGNSVQFELVRSSWEDFFTGFVLFYRLVMILRRNGCFSYDDRLLTSAVARCKQALDRLDGNLSCADDVSGFVRETIESEISGMWKSIFDGTHEEAGTKEETIRIFDYMFLPLVGKPYADLTAEERALPVWGHQGIQELPMHSTSSYILSNRFAKQALKEELVKLGVEISVLVAESMFLLSDDIHGVLLFCHNKIHFKASRSVNRDFPIHKRLLRGMHHVYTKLIKPKHPVYDRNGSRSVHLPLASRVWKDFDAAVSDLDLLLWILRGEGTFVHGRDLVSGLEKAFKKIDDKLRSVKDVSEANGYARDEIEPKINGLWKSIFVLEDAEDARLMRIGIITDLFRSLHEKN